MLTKNQIHKKFKDFADNHLQIKFFGYGDLPELSQSVGTTYPLLWISPQPSPVNGYQIAYTYFVMVADRTMKGHEDIVEVESDTFQICLDFLAFLNDQSNNDFELNETTTITPFEDEHKDEISGHIMTISFNVDFNYNECQIPKIN